MKMKSSTRASGFSLVELLVVITIIVVLATLSFSIVGQMMGRAKIANATNCMLNNGLALHQYIADNNRTFPGPLIWYQGVGLKGTLFNFLAPYMGTEKLPANEKDIFATAAYSSYVLEYLRKSAAGNLSHGYFAVDTQGFLDRGDGVNQSVWGYGPNRDTSGNIERPRKLTELLTISRLTAKAVALLILKPGWPLSRRSRPASRELR